MTIGLVDRGGDVHQDEAWRAPTLTPHATPPAPYAFGDNPHTLLAVSDLVFLDAVGTGFSRLAGDGRPDEVWGVDQDVEVFARAILRYLTMTGSWQAPRYLFGESYGTSRAAALVYRLQNLGADFNGVVMLSTLLNWATTQPGPGIHQPAAELRRGRLVSRQGQVRRPAAHRVPRRRPPVRARRLRRRAAAGRPAAGRDRASGRRPPGGLHRPGCHDAAPHEATDRDGGLPPGVAGSGREADRPF